jgi:hypothetical protein
MGPELNRLRLRAPRELWDPAYRAESWIGNTTAEAPAVLPRVRQWIADHNPGMGLCVGEYNFGGADNVTGGLAQADVFGILARERADLAFLWHTPEGSQVLAWRLFRSYDGKGGRFGDRLLGAASDQADLAAYAGRRTADGATTVVLINKRLGGPCTVTLAGLPGGYRAWRFDQDSGAKVVPVPEAAGPLTLPPASATVVVFAGGGG